MRMIVLFCLAALTVATMDLSAATRLATQGNERLESHDNTPAMDVVIDGKLLAESGPQTLELPTPDGGVISLERLRIDRRTSRSFTWHGMVAGARNSSIISVHGNAFAGAIHTPEGLYEIRPYPAGHVVMERSVMTKKPCAEAPEISQERLDLAAKQVQERQQATTRGSTRTDDGSVIQVLIAYTGEATQSLGNADNMQAFAQLCIDLANDAYANSNVAPRLNLAAVIPTGYSETGNGGLDLDRLADPFDGNGDNLPVYRDEYKADLVAVLADETVGICGIAYRYGNFYSSPSQMAPFGYSVTDIECVVFDTVSHELGHNQGCVHDHVTSARQGLQYSTLYNDYGHGHFENGEFHTIMAYGSACSSFCVGIRNFSNPDINFGGSPTGVVGGLRVGADAARTLDESAVDVANFRVGAPPVQEFVLPTLGQWGVVLLLGAMSFALAQWRNQRS